MIVIALCLWQWSVHWRPRLSDFPVQGVDVREGDGAIDWWAAKASGVQFAYAVATAGAQGRDSRFAEYWRGAEAADLQRGAIHVFSLCQPTLDQAGNFVSTVPRTGDQLSPVLLLDFQPGCAARPGRAQVIAAIRHMLGAMETHSGHQAMLKITPGFDAQYQVSAAIARPLWGVRSFFSPAYLARPWTIWQASSFRRIDGAAKPVNWDVMAK